MPTIKQALASADSLKGISDSARLDAELLLAQAIGESREHLFTWPDKELSDLEIETFEGYLGRRAAGEPVAYILGKQAFWDFELLVNPAVLIPRPETELLVETAKALLEARQLSNASILDLGTGSGAIALALASCNSSWQLLAVDNCESTLAVARKNAELLGFNNVEFHKASWCDGLQSRQFDLIAANPPYVEQGDAHLTEGSLPFEPVAALVAEDGGLADIRAIAEQARSCLKRDAWLLIEHGYQQRKPVRKILEELGYESIECLTDLAGLERMTKAQYKL